MKRFFGVLFILAGIFLFVRGLALIANISWSPQLSQLAYAIAVVRYTKWGSEPSNAGLVYPLTGIIFFFLGLLLLRGFWFFRKKRS